MSWTRPISRVAAVVLTSAVVLTAAVVAPRVGLGQGEGGVPGRDLLRTPPFDRVTLNDGTTLEIEPISPRPLPEYDARLAQRVADRVDTIPREGNILLPSQKEELAARKKRAEEAKKAAEQIAELNVKPIDDPNVYKVKRTSIRSIEYFEDMLLAAGERLVAQRNFAKAFEHYLLVKNRAGDWKGLQEHVDHLLYEEASDALLKHDAEHGLRLLRELHARRPDFPGLLDKLAKGYGERVKRAFEQGAYPEGRRILRELSEFAPDHPIAAELRGLFVRKSQNLAERARTADDPASRVDLLAEALHIWPDLEDADAHYREAFAALPTLDVAVSDVPRPVGPWARSPADVRASRLLYLPILAADDEDALRGRRTDQLAANLEVADLGRRLDLTLRTGPSWSDGSGPVTAIDVVRSLAERANPNAPRYNARWEDLLDRVELVGPHRVLISLRRTPLKPEAWLRGPIGPAHAGLDGRVPMADGSRQVVGDGPFVLRSITDSNATYAASDGQEVAIRRVREVRVPDGSDAIRALRRGEVSLVEHLPSNRVAEVSADKDYGVGRYTQPRLHFLALDGRAEVLSNRMLRRAISYAIDRETILEETLLGRATDAENRPSDGVFPVDSYGNATGVEPLEHNALMARMLVAAARQEMESGPIQLTFEYPAIPEARLAAPKIADSLRKAGLEIDSVERPESTLETDLRSGRRFDIAYRALTCHEPVADVGPLICPGYDAPTSTDSLGAIASPRILQLLLGLEHAPEFPTARGIVIQIDREVRDELPIIPLWQLQDHYAWRGRLKGPTDESNDLYQGIERWEIEPWFARDPW